MKSYLISVGCDKYNSDTISDLSGAENDAEAIYEALVNSEYSIYEKDSSHLLKSTSIYYVRKALEEVLFDRDPPDVFTFFFAGHGGVIDGTYYLCLNETRTDRMSFTGLSLTEIFRIVSSSNVKHVNLIIDACNTAGLVHDLLSLVKPDLIGAKGSFGVSILAAAASDEAASEIGGQGLLTGSLLNLINGTVKVNSDVEFLDLVNLGRAISTKFIEEGIKQTPSSWGMNLYGPSIFSKNPFHNNSETISTSDFSFIPPASRVGQILTEFKDELWDLYDDLDDTEGVENFVKIIKKAGGKTDNLDDLIVLLRGVGYRFIQKYTHKPNFKQLEVINALATCLIPHLHDERAKITIKELESLYKKYCHSLLTHSIAGLRKDKYQLLNRDGSGFDVLANHYYLPIRISKLLGYFAQLLLVDNSYLERVNEFLDIIKNEYKSQLICISEEQAPYLYCFFRIYSSLVQESHKLPTFILISYIKDYLRCRGQVASLHLTPEDSAKYLIQRYSQDKIEMEYKANPDSLGSSLLLQTNSYGINEDVDSVLHIMDRNCFHLFIPSNTTQFGDKIIKDGYNIVLNCGSQFWSCDEFGRIINENFSIYGDGFIDTARKQERFACIASCFVQPDRIPLMV